MFVEVDAKTFCMDVDLLRNAITSKTKAIVPVHLYGHAANMEAIMQVAKEHNLYVIEDNAQAIVITFLKMAHQKRPELLEPSAISSFFPAKNLGCYGDGGALFTNDAKLAEQMKMIANHGQSKRYYHDVVGCNSRLDTMQAAILNIKLKKLDEYIAARQKAAAFYNNAFANNPKIEMPFRAAYSSHVFHQYTLILHDADRDELNKFLAEKNIPSMIYYPVPGHRQKMFENSGGLSYNLPVTDWLTERVISLPIHTELDEEQLNFITTSVLKFMDK